MRRQDVQHGHVLRALLKVTEAPTGPLHDPFVVGGVVCQESEPEGEYGEEDYLPV